MCDWYLRVQVNTFVTVVNRRPLNEISARFTVSNRDSVASLSVAFDDWSRPFFFIRGVSGLAFSPLRCDGPGNRQRGSVLLQFTLISPASWVWNYKLRGLPHSHFTRLQVISQTRRAYTSPVPQFSQSRIWTFILDHPLFFHLSTLLIYVRLSRRAHGRGATTAWCEIGFDLSEKSCPPPLPFCPSSPPLSPASHLSYALSFRSLSFFQNKAKWFLPHPFVLERGDKLQMCSRAFVLEMPFHTRRENWWKASSTSKWFDGGADWKV